MTVGQLLRHLWWPSMVNRAKAQLGRLRQPRYGVATLLGLAYWLWYLVARWPERGAPRLPEAMRPAAELGLTSVGLFMALLYWVLGAERGALAFSQAEIQLLFPAPLTRQQLVHYKLLRSVLAGLLGAAITTLLFGRRVGHPLWFTLGSWVALTTLALHALGASFARARLLELGLARGAKGLLGMTPAFAYGAALAVGWSRLHLPPLEPGLPYFTLLAAQCDQGLLGALLFPVRASARLALAPDLPAFARALPAALGVAAVHYLWVIRSAVGFEDASLEWAEQRARWLERRQGGLSGVRPLASRAPPFRLGPRGRPELALAWKGLITAGWLQWARLTGVVTGLALTALLLLRLGLFPFVEPEAQAMVVPLIATLGLLVTGLATLLGPLLVRFDLRQDLASLEVLRTLPLSGRALVAGELAAPALLLASVQWAGLTVAWAGSDALVPLPGPARGAVVLSLALLAPCVTLLGLLVQNAIAVLFPGWVPTGPSRTVGPEAAGLRLLTLLGNLLVVGLALVPAALLALVPGVLLFGPLGFAAVPLAALLATVVLLAEAAFATAALGYALERTWEPHPLLTDGGGA